MNYILRITTNSIIILVFLAAGINAQVTKIRGIVVDDETGGPLPFSGVSFKGTTIATITDINGVFSLETRTPSDTLYVTCVGYETQKVFVKKNSYQELNFRLKHTISELDEVVIFPGENPAHPILKKIIDNKQQNNPDNYVNSYQFEIYNKYQLDINNVDSVTRQRKVFSSLDFVFDYMDTSALTGKTYLPVFLVESVSEYYYRRQPPFKREVIKASKVSGIDNPSVSQFTGKTFQQFNIYENTLSIIDEDFISPISNYGLMYYRYYIVDTAFIGTHWCYQIAYHPRRISERTFSGYFWVNDSTWAIKNIQMQFGKEPNINFLNNFSANLTYEKFDSIWFLTEEDYVTDFNMTNSSTGFFATKSSVYRNCKFNQTIPKDVLRQSTPIAVTDSANRASEAYWEKARPYELSQKEKDIYLVVDSVKKLRIYRVVEDAIYLLSDYYYIIGPFEYGPYFTTYSFNPIEGNRFRVGGRTSNAFSTKVMIEGHVAYGTLDNKFKYKISVLYMFSKSPRKALYASYQDDISQMGMSEGSFREDNILASLFRTSPNNTLTPCRKFKAYYESDLGWGFTGRITGINQAIDTTKYMHFLIRTDEDTVWAQTVKNTEITIGLRYARMEKFLWGEFERYSLGTRSPIFNFDFSMGMKIPNMGEYEYYKFHIGIADKVQLNPFGYFKYKADAGLILGHVPYLFLELHPSNQTFFYDFSAFNMMNYYEFASDRYFSFVGEQHFQGFFFNKVPLFERLNLREVITYKMVIGDASEENLAYMEPPFGLTAVNKPYMEAGVGVENIFRVLRVDAVWRLSYLDKPNVTPFGIRFLIQFIL